MRKKSKRSSKIEVIIENHCYRQIRRLKAFYRRKVEKQIQNLARDPFPSNSKELGEECEELDMYRLRIDDYRVVYHYDKLEKVATVKKVGLKRGPEFYEGVC